MRLIVGLLIAVIVNYGLFTLMQKMVSSDGIDGGISEDIQILDFVRVKKEEQQLETKKRQRPEPPPPPEKQPPPPSASAPEVDQPDVPRPDLDAPQIDVPMDLAGGPQLGDFKADPAPEPAPAAETTEPAAQGSADDEVTPLVRIPPTYPRRAQRRGIEGVVTVAFTITKDGTVQDPEVVDAEPANIFNDEALRAIKKWKFKPRVVDGQPQARRATQEIEFRMSR